MIALEVQVRATYAWVHQTLPVCADIELAGERLTPRNESGEAEEKK
jgi:hypothetical protein